MSMDFFKAAANLTIRENLFGELPKFIEKIGSSKISSFEEADRRLNGQGDGFVRPHYVSGYTRADGTQVRGYYRDGDGNPNTNLTVEQGGGYYR